MSKNDGGPAFPNMRIAINAETGDQFVEYVGGASLRDLFAAAALQGRTSRENYSIRGNEIIFADVAYKMADAMLKERERVRGDE